MAFEAIDRISVLTRTAHENEQDSSSTGLKPAHRGVALVRSSQGLPVHEGIELSNSGQEKSPVDLVTFIVDE